jgi:hypothetical protein
MSPKTWFSKKKAIKWIVSDHHVVLDSLFCLDLACLFVLRRSVLILSGSSQTRIGPKNMLQIRLSGFDIAGHLYDTYIVGLASRHCRVRILVTFCDHFVFFRNHLVFCFKPASILKISTSYLKVQFGSRTIM